MLITLEFSPLKNKLDDVLTIIDLLTIPSSSEPEGRFLDLNRICPIPDTTTRFTGAPLDSRFVTVSNRVNSEVELWGTAQSLLPVDITLRKDNTHCSITIHSRWGELKPVIFDTIALMGYPFTVHINRGDDDDPSWLDTIPDKIYK